MLNEFRETAITWDKANRKIYESLRVSAGDNKGRKLSVQLVNDGVIEDLSGASLSLFWETKDKAHKGLDAFTAVDATKGEFEIYYTTGMLSNEGTLNANLVLVDASGRIVSEPFKITVFKGIDDDAIQSSDSFTALTEALIDINDLEQNYAPRLSTLEQNDVSLSQQLQQNTYFGIENQTDFVDVVRKTNAKPNTLYTKIRSDRNIEVCIPFKGNKSQQWYVDKDPNDDFMKLSGGFVSEYVLSSIVSGAKEYDSRTGTWNTSTINHYTSEVGATFTTTFEGNGVNFRHMEDTRGGIWRFVVDDDPNLTLDYSTYGTSNSTKNSKLFEFLPDGEHKVVGTFMGDDPNNPPSGGAGTSRGWVYASGGTFQILITRYSFSKEVEVFKMTSNKEFAIAVTPSGATTAQWIPEHNNIGSAFAITQAVYFDNELVTDWTGQSNYYQYSSVQIVQKMHGKHPDNPNNLVEFITIHTFNADGVFIKTKMKVLENTTINTGYALMCPVNFAFTDKMVTSLDNAYEITSTSAYDSTNLSENDKALSYLFIGNSSYPNYVGAMTINQPKKTLRVGKDGRRNPLAWLEFRASNSIAKLYPQMFNNYQATVGESFEFSGSYAIGEISFANELYG